MCCMQLCTLQEVRKAQAANRARLDEEYRRLVGNLVEAQQLRGGEEWLANPALPEDIVRESMPGAGLHCLG
jgi:DNA excision repair protein ERCC-2